MRASHVASPPTVSHVEEAVSGGISMWVSVHTCAHELNTQPTIGDESVQRASARDVDRRTGRFVEATQLVDELLPACSIGRPIAEGLGQEQLGASPAERVLGSRGGIGVQRDGAFETCDGAAAITGAQGGHAVAEHRRGARDLVSPTATRRPRAG